MVEAFCMFAYNKESKQKLKEFRTGFKPSEDSKQKMGVGHLKLSKEQIEKIIYLLENSQSSLN
jgi:hypothetical protein